MALELCLDEITVSYSWDLDGRCIAAWKGLVSSSEGYVTWPCITCISLWLGRPAPEYEGPHASCWSVRIYFPGHGRSSRLLSRRAHCIWKDNFVGIEKCKLNRGEGSGKSVKSPLCWWLNAGLICSSQMTFRSRYSCPHFCRWGPWVLERTSNWLKVAEQRSGGAQVLA